jgi:hypothetical protein
MAARRYKYGRKRGGSELGPLTKTASKGSINKMKILEIKDIVRKDVPIYYRRLFVGTAVIELLGGPEDYPVDFSIENKPTGEKEILVSFSRPPDYPLIPLVREMKQLIDQLDLSGGLPG